MTSMEAGKAPEPRTDGEEKVSPEGVEEKVVWSETYDIVLTGGGKYRIYHTNHEGNRSPVPVVFDRFQAAWEAVHKTMTLLCRMALDPGGILKDIASGKMKP